MVLVVVVILATKFLVDGTSRSLNRTAAECVGVTVAEVTRMEQEV